ncbi:hypothetical protein TRIATDRAFT_314988, partial [Trichoderma atroviride IMI 206040]
MASYTGTCNCGSVTVTLATAPSMIYACHCLNCRRAGGRMGNFDFTVSYSTDNEIAFSMNYILGEDEVTVHDSKNSRKQYVDTNTTSKATVKRTFCQNCGSPLYS